MGKELTDLAAQGTAAWVERDRWQQLPERLGGVEVGSLKGQERRALEGAAAVGLDSVPLSVPGGAEYRQAFIRLKAREGLYAEDPGGVDFVDRGLFRAQVDLPVSAPVGRYRVEVLLFQDGKPVARRGRDLTIEKVGVERLNRGVAQQNTWCLALITLLRCRRSYAARSCLSFFYDP